MTLHVHARSSNPFQLAVRNLSHQTPNRSRWLTSLAGACVLTLAFGLLPCKPAVAQQEVSPPNPETTSSEPPTESKRNLERVLATILQSGSTNTLPYKVTIYKDGSATAEGGGSKASAFTHPPLEQPSVRSEEFPSGTVDAKKLRHLLAQIRDVTRIPTGSCPKSVSFGTNTRISYAGKTSGDLQCIRAQNSNGDQELLQASENLGKFVQTMLGEMEINRRRISPNP